MVHNITHNDYHTQWMPMSKTHCLSQTVLDSALRPSLRSVEPPGAPAESRQMKLLAALLAVFVPLIALLTGLFLALDPPRGPVYRPVVPVVVGLVAVLLLAYAINRRGRFTAAAWLTVGALTAAVFAAALADPAHNLSLLMYLALPILLSSALLPLQTVAALSLAVLAALLALALLGPPELVYNELPVVFILLTACVVLLVMHHRDRLERDRRAALEASEARLRTVFMDAPTGMAIVDAGKRFLRVNTRLRRMLDFTEAELLERTLLDVVHPEDRIMLQEIEAGGSGTIRLEFRCLTRAGAPLWVRLSASELRDPQMGEGCCRLLMLQDISARREAERQAREAERLRLALEQERELRAYKTRFTSAVSHEFRTPLAVIMASAEILQRYEDRIGPERKAEHYSRIQEQVQRLARMVETLLAVGRADDPQVLFTPQPLDPVAFCSALADELLAADAGQHPFTFTHTGAFDGFQADRDLLRLALSSLLENALESTPAGGAVSLALHGMPEGVTFTVSSDTGVDLPPEDQLHLFEPFHRPDSADLALYLVKVCADRHGGTVSCASAPNQGTAITMRLPLRASSLVAIEPGPMLR